MPINNRPGKLIRFRVDYKSGNTVITAKEQALRILNKVDELHKQFPNIQIGITYSANQSQSNSIIECYRQRRWKTSTNGANQASVIFEIEKLLSENKYKHLQQVYRTIPFTTMKYTNMGIGAADDDSLEKCIDNANTFIRGGGIVMGWTNQDSNGKIAIGGGVAKGVQTYKQKQLIQQWIKNNLVDEDPSEEFLNNTYPFQVDLTSRSKIMNKIPSMNDL